MRRWPRLTRRFGLALFCCALLSGAVPRLSSHLPVPSISLVVPVSAQDNVGNGATGTIASCTGGTLSSCNTTVTTMVFTSGQGARFPPAPFRCVWWNSTDYTRPGLDPNVEIPRVTALSGDTATITRAYEPWTHGGSATAKNHNTAGKTYQCDVNLTDDMWHSATSNDLIYNTVSGTASISICGSTNLLTGTSSDYTVTLPAIATHTGCSVEFHGFGGLTKLVTVARAGSDTFDDGSTSIVMWAGEDLVVSNDGTYWAINKYSKRRMRASLERHAAQSIPDSTQTPIDLDTEIYDVGGIGDPSTHVITIRRTGVYMVTGCWWANGSTTGQVRVLVNTTTPLVSAYFGTNASAPVPLSAGDVVMFAVFHAAGVSMNTYAVASSGACIFPHLSAVEQ